jgi:IclR family transcriptional regulator, acetate operon repressor
VSTTGTQAVDRAAELLSRVVLADSPPVFGELVAGTGLAESTAHRLLHALERHQLVHRHESGGFSAGPLFTLYASRTSPLEELVTLAKPTMQELSAATGETVNLAVARGNTVMQVAQIDSTFLLGTTNWVDVDVPAHCSALGKIFYAASVLATPSSSLERLTERTFTDPTEFAGELARIREQGYAVTRGELEIGLDAVAAPVYDATGKLVAALGISGPSDRVGGQLARLGPLLKSSAETLSGALGYKQEKGAA